MNASRLIVDVALAVTVVELVVLFVLRRKQGLGEAVAVLANVGAGLFLMLALRAALDGADWPWLAACLAAAGTAHVADMTMRRRDS